MKDLPLIALRALACVHAHNGVRAAAADLGIAHSSVSRHLTELEKWLGVAIVDRSRGPRDFALTPQGEALAAAALRSMRRLAHAAAAINEAKGPRSVTVSTTPSIAARWLLPRLNAANGHHLDPEISVSVDQRVVDLRTEGVDLAIRMGRGPWPDLICEPLMDDALYPVMSPEFFERTQRPRRVDQLRVLRLLHDRDPVASWAVWRDAKGPRELDVRRGPRYGSSDLVLQAAAMSQGVALARHRMAFDEIARGTLVRPFGKQAVVLRDAYWIVMPARAQRRSDVKALADWLRQRASECGVG
jgi:LysR family transcriptional regulator, glycine cleavage system transcriptional activator